jgi:Prp8 binding protein
MLVSHAATPTTLIESSASHAKPCTVLQGHGAAVLSCTFAAHGGLAASAAANGSVLLWDVAKGGANVAQLQPSGNDAAAVTQCVFTCDDRHVAVAAADGALACFDVATAKLAGRFKGGKARGVLNTVAAMRFQSDVVAVGGDDGDVVMHDMRLRRSQLRAVKTAFPVTAAAFAKTDGQLFYGGVDGVLHVFDLRAGKEELAVAAHQDIITDVVLSPSGDAVMTRGMDAAMCVIDVRPFAIDRLISCAQTGANSKRLLLRGAWSRSGGLVACGEQSGDVSLFAAGGGGDAARVPGHQKQEVNDVALHPHEERLLLSASADGTLLLGEV